MFTFQEAIQDFTPILAKDLKDLLATQQDVVVFIGRETCPYCQRFAPKLSRVAKEKGVKVYFLHSQNPVDLAETQALRDAYGVKTVPGLLVAKAGQVKVVCDSSLSEEAITAFIN